VNLVDRCTKSVVGDDGFEPSKLKATDLQSAPFGRSGNLPNKVVVIDKIDNYKLGAGGRI
jgi:glucose-6-phosphate isomerase